MDKMGLKRKNLIILSSFILKLIFDCMSEKLVLLVILNIQSLR